MFAKLIIAIGIIFMFVSTGTADSVPHSTVFVIACIGLFLVWLGNELHFIIEGNHLISFNPKT